MSLNIETLRNLTGVLNRTKALSSADYQFIINTISPPFKGEQPRRKPPVTYPTQLSGLHEEGRMQQISISGNASNPQVHSIGIGGMSTGGSYIT